MLCSKKEMSIDVSEFTVTDYLKKKAQFLLLDADASSDSGSGRKSRRQKKPNEPKEPKVPKVASKEVSYDFYMQGMTGVFIPANLVQLDSDNKTFVWVVNGDKALKREIIISKETAQGAQVSGGLSAGDQLIVAGQQKVSNGMKVEVVK